MIQVRKNGERGHAVHGWLDSYHTFSFADYYDPEHMGFRSLRVINEDYIAPGRGFGKHGHRDMEILTYVVKGSLRHQDSMGHQEVLGPNEIQRMSAGSGLMHSEFNASATEPLHLLQIWIQPATTGGVSSYEQIAFKPQEKQGSLKLLASSKGGNGAAQINQDAKLFAAELNEGEELLYNIGSKRYGWLQVIQGSVSVNGTTLGAGDAGALSKEERLTIVGNASGPSEFLLFDLA